MSEDERPKILIVDDDEAFRNLVVRLLSQRGFEVLEARSTRDANYILSKNKLVLLIVDYKLPDVDGMTWIQQLRERNVSVPIAFCSGIWCDQSTFNWLRNILRVALVLNKPIDPQLFVEVIESVLPRPKPVVENEDGPSLPVLDKTFIELEYEQILQKYPGSALAKAELNNIINSPETQTELIERLKMLRRKLEVEEAVSVAKVKYLAELGRVWPVLTKEMRQYKDDPRNRSAYENALNLAHKLRGTAGSFHINKVAHAAGKLEDMLQSLDPTDDLSAEVIWSEIFRHLSEGEISIREEREALGSYTVSENIISLIKVLVVGDAPALQALVSTPEVTAVAECTQVTTLEKALATVRNSPFDCMVVGPPLSAHPELMKFTQEVRISEDNHQAPMILITSVDTDYTAAELKYAGFADFLPATTPGRLLAGSIEHLTAQRDLLKSRVLLVDDDEVLTNFVGRILKGNGYVTDALNEPIRIMDKLIDFEPDLLILDVIMPGLTGYDVCRLIRGDARWRELTVLFLTAKSNQEGRANAFRAGGDDLLSKPVLTEELLARVSTYLQVARLKKTAAEVDTVTGLFNRNTFLRRAEKLFDSGAEQFTLCMFALDNFDKLTEHHGEFLAESVLSTMGRLMSTRFQPSVIKGRWGEKGFALCFTGEDSALTEALVQQLGAEFAAIPFVGKDGQPVSVTFTSSFARAQDDGVIFAQLRDMGIQRLLDNIHARLSASAKV